MVIPPQHDKFTLGKIDNAGGIIDHVKSKPYHSIDTADSNPGEQILYELAEKRHGCYCFVLKPAALQRDRQILNNSTMCIFILGLRP
jgi:hypothetical protein